jgi:hypothetical protein
VPVVIFLVAAVILGAVVVVAMGRGGELARNRTDLPARTDFQTWSDVSGYRPPPALLGYHAGATEHALSLIARTIAERDAEIDWLRKRLTEAQPASATDVAGQPGEAELLDDGAWQAGHGAEPGQAFTVGSSVQPTPSRRAGEDE